MYRLYRKLKTAVFIAALLSTIGNCRCVGKLPDSEPIIVMPNEEGIGWVWQIEPGGDSSTLQVASGLGITPLFTNDDNETQVQSVAACTGGQWLEAPQVRVARQDNAMGTPQDEIVGILNTANWPISLQWDLQKADTKAEQTGAWNVEISSADTLFFAFEITFELTQRKLGQDISTNVRCQLLHVLGSDYIQQVSSISGVSNQELTYIGNNDKVDCGSNTGNDVEIYQADCSLDASQAGAVISVDESTKKVTVNWTWDESSTNRRYQHCFFEIKDASGPEIIAKVKYEISYRYASAIGDMKYWITYIVIKQTEQWDATDPTTSFDTSTNLLTYTFPPILSGFDPLISSASYVHELQLYSSSTSTWETLTVGVQSYIGVLNYDSTLRSMVLTLTENWDAGNLSSYRFRHKLIKDIDGVSNELVSPEWIVTYLNLDPCGAVTLTVTRQPDYVVDQIGPRYQKIQIVSNAVAPVNLNLLNGYSFSASDPTGPVSDSICPVWVQINGQEPASPNLPVNSDGSITTSHLTINDIPDAYDLTGGGGDSKIASQRYLIVITFSVRVRRSSATSETLSPLLENQRYELMFGTCPFDTDTLELRTQEIEFNQVTAIKEMEPILTIPDPTTIFTLQSQKTIYSESVCGGTFLFDSSTTIVVTPAVVNPINPMVTGLNADGSYYVQVTRDLQDDEIFTVTINYRMRIGEQDDMILTKELTFDIQIDTLYDVAKVQLSDASYDEHIYFPQATDTYNYPMFLPTSTSELQSTTFDEHYRLWYKLIANLDPLDLPETWCSMDSVACPHTATPTEHIENDSTLVIKLDTIIAFETNNENKSLPQTFMTPPSGATWSRLETTTSRWTQTECGQWTVMNSGTVVEQIITFRENVAGYQTVEYTIKCQYSHSKFLELQQYEQTIMDLEFEGGESQVVYFQAPRFKYDMSKDEEDNYWTQTYPDHIDIDIRLPNATEPMRSISFLVDQMGVNETQADYFTYYVVDNGYADTQITKVLFTMPEFCFKETFGIFVCYNYGNGTDEINKLQNVQNLCDYDAPHNITCNNIIIPREPIAFNEVQSTYTVIYGKKEDITLEFINPLMQEASIPQHYKDKLQGVEIKVVENKYPGLVIATPPTYLESGVGIIELKLDGATAQDSASLDENGKLAPIVAFIRIAVQDLNEGGKTGTFDIIVIFKLEDQIEVVDNSEDARFLELLKLHIGYLKLTCSPQDATWGFYLPKKIEGWVGEITYEYNPNTSTEKLFSYNQDQAAVSFKDQKTRVAVMKSKICPNKGLQFLEFKVKRKDKNTLTLDLPIIIQPIAKTSITGFEKLRINNIDVSQIGRVSVKFNKDIEAPGIKIGRRVLQESTGITFPVSDVIEADIVDADLSEEGLNKTILSITNVETEQKNQLEVQIEFAKPNDITANIAEPDKLFFKILRPELIVDAETKEFLEEENSALTYNIPLKQQMTQDEFNILQNLKDTAVIIGGGLAIWQIGMFIALQKVLSKLWLLINCFQFFVYIAIWQINYPKEVKLFITELRRCVLGEFMDDLEFGKTISEFLGINTDKKSEPQDEVGRDRVGSKNIVDNLGLSLILMTLLIVLVIIIVVLIKTLSCKSCSKRCMIKVNWLKDKIFFSPLLRYHYLNQLKLNMSAMMTIWSLGDEDTDVYQKFISISIFLTLNLLPFFYARVLYNRRDKLHKTRNVQTIGSLYEGFVRDSDNVKRRLRLDRPKKVEIKRRAYIYPIAFLLRRSIFTVITVCLFDYPVLQMILHIQFSLIYICILISLRENFTTRQRLFTELSVEAISMSACIWLQVLLMPLEEKGKELVTYMFLGTLGLATFVVILDLILTLIYKQLDKRLQKRRKKLMDFKYEQAKLMRMFEKQRLYRIEQFNLKMEIEAEREAREAREEQEERERFEHDVKEFLEACAEHKEAYRKDREEKKRKAKEKQERRARKRPESASSINSDVAKFQEELDAKLKPIADNFMKNTQLQVLIPKTTKTNVVEDTDAAKEKAQNDSINKLLDKMSKEQDRQMAMRMPLKPKPISSFKPTEQRLEEANLNRDIFNNKQDRNDFRIQEDDIVAIVEEEINRAMSQRIETNRRLGGH